MDQYIALLGASFGLSIISAILVLLGVWIGREWLVTRLAKSIEHEYATKLEEYKHEHTTKLEEYKYEIEKRKKVEVVAKLLAHWIAHRNPDLEQQKELNRLTFECYLWLPDEIAVNLADLFAHERENEVSVKTILIEIRKLLNKDDVNYSKLNNMHLTHFNPQGFKSSN